MIEAFCCHETLAIAHSALSEVTKIEGKRLTAACSSAATAIAWKCIVAKRAALKHCARKSGTRREKPKAPATKAMSLKLINKCNNIENTSLKNMHKYIILILPSSK